MDDSAELEEPLRTPQVLATLDMALAQRCLMSVAAIKSSTTSPEEELLLLAVPTCVDHDRPKLADVE